MRRKHQPTRTCVACREAKEKRALVRVVRQPDGSVVLDPSGKANGRGAYLCKQAACWERALKRRILNHALKCELDERALTQLQAHAAALVGESMDA